MRKLTPLIVLLLAALLYGAADAEERARVVVVKTNSVQAFEIAAAALIAELADEMDVHVVSGEPPDRRAIDRIRSMKPDVLVPIGTQATEWVAREIESVPIVFSMVLNPVAVGLVESLDAPGGRVTGAALDISSSQQLRTMRDVIRARRIAVLYNPERSGQLVNAAERDASRLGVELVPIAVEDRSQFSRALAQVDDSFDALWSVPDSMVFSHKLAQQIILHTIRKRVPTMGLSEQYVRAGALFALVSSYTENGRQAAERLRMVTRGRDPGKIPVARPEKLEIVFNARTAENLNVRLKGVSYARQRPVR